jgi:NADH-quinone oxidoreductase subunit A
MTDLNFHLVLAVIVGATLVLLPLLVGLFVRPRLPTPEKDAVYECGEPTIGSSYIQFDLRFYVVALLFIIFDVEVVFFFPWATIFGGASQLADPTLTEATRLQLSDKLLSLPAGTTTVDTMVNVAAAQQMAWIGLADILVFFGVLLVGFAYVWHRGDLDWVRAMVVQARQAAAPATPRRVLEPVVSQPPQSVRL